MILSIFRPKRPPIAEMTHAVITEAARDPSLFTDLAVPDTVEGRFEMVVLFAILYVERADRDPALAELVQEVVDWTFLEFDRALRDLGVSDTRVPKKMKGLAEAFYGRVAAYKPALAAGDRAALSQALRRIVYADADTAPADRLAARVLEAKAALDRTPREDLLAGRPRFEGSAA